MALKTNFEATNDIASPFVDEVANPGDQRSVARTQRDNQAIRNARESEAADTGPVALPKESNLFQKLMDRKKTTDDLSDTTK